jgi:hypothetical protein
MSERIATEEREFRMPGLLSAAKESIKLFFTSLKLRFTPRIIFPESRLQTEGASGDDILEFQQRFNRFGCPHRICGPLTGVYDIETRRAVARYQREVLYVLDSDGFVGPVTARELRIKLLEG